MADRHDLYTDDSDIAVSELRDHELILTLSPGELKVLVPFPDTYPKTRLRSTAPALAELLLTWNTSGVMLHSFYVYTHPSTLHGEAASPNERIATVGLGRRMMCLAVRVLLSTENLSPETPFRLEASGGKCDHLKIRAVLLRHDEHELDSFLKRHQAALDAFADDYGRLPTLEEKATMKCEYDENQRLVAYYKRYGFMEDEVSEISDLNYTPMHCTLGAALDACDAGRDGTGDTEYKLIRKKRRL
jgi:hypothetical protein